MRKPHWCSQCTVPVRRRARCHTATGESPARTVGVLVPGWRHGSRGAEQQARKEGFSPPLATSIRGGQAPLGKTARQRDELSGLVRAFGDPIEQGQLRMGMFVQAGLRERAMDGAWLVRLRDKTRRCTKRIAVLSGYEPGCSDCERRLLIAHCDADFALLMMLTACCEADCVL